MQNIASAFFSSKRRQKDWTSSLFSLFRKINEAGLLNFAMNNNGVLYLYWSHLDQCSSPWCSQLNAKYAASGVTFFISMVRCAMNIFFNLSISSPFFFLDIKFTNVLFCYFFTGVPMLCELEIWVLELLMRFAQPRFADIFTRKYRPVTCNLVNTLK